MMDIPELDSGFLMVGAALATVAALVAGIDITGWAALTGG